jgi:regulator of sigma E protease
MTALFSLADRIGSAIVFLADRVGVFIVVLGILILIHELGHFFVARWTGVGVERFSIGFGPVLARWRGKETEYCVSAIPMGGYVKMMGEENPLEGGGSPVFDPQKAFSLKPLWARFLIVFAGPGMNFVLAWVIFAVILAVVGRPVWPAVLGRVTADGAAAAAGLQPGDVVTAIDGRPIAYWEDLERAIAGSDGRPLRLTIERGTEQREVQATPKRIVTRDPIFKESREVWSLGTGPQVTPQVGMVTPDSPAERAGLRIGDIVVAVGGQPVFTSDELTQAIQQAGGKPIDVVVQRDDKPLTVTVTANRVKEKSETGQDVENWRIGVILASKVVRSERYNPVAAVGYGAVRTWELTALTVKVLWKFVKLDLPLSNLGGPIQIATESHRQRQEGLAQLAGFTAFISVNLAVLNLLPVPMLDGGHLLFFVIEGILGRPVSLKKREAAQQLGLVLLLLLMVFAIYNDLVRIDAFRIFR